MPPTPTQQQVDKLLTPLLPKRVHLANGQAHLPGWDVIATLTRVFGFAGWDKRVDSLDLVFESERTKKTPNKPDRQVWDVCYRCQITLTVRFADGSVKVTQDLSTGDAEGQPGRAAAHDLAVKSAVTLALKRCAKDLGDQFGLSLYEKGNTDALVRVTMVGSSTSVDSAAVATAEQEAPAPTGMGMSEGGDAPEPQEHAAAPEPAGVHIVDDGDRAALADIEAAKARRAAELEQPPPVEPEPAAEPPANLIAELPVDRKTATAIADNALRAVDVVGLRGNYKELRENNEPLLGVDVMPSFVDGSLPSDSLPVLNLVVDPDDSLSLAVVLVRVGTYISKHGKSVLSALGE